MLKAGNIKKLIMLTAFVLAVLLILTNILFPFVFFIKNGYRLIDIFSQWRFDLLFLAFTREVIPPNTFSALGNSIILASVLMACVYFFVIRVKKVDLHGRARFANDQEIDKFINQKEGIVIGKHKGKLLRFGGQQFVMLAAPSRSGKGVSVVIPNLLEWTDSLVVLDIKKEAFTITSKYRQQILRQEVFLFSPFMEGSSRYNPLDYVDWESKLADLQVEEIASILYASKDENEFFTAQGKKLFVGMCLFAYDILKDTGESITLTKVSGFATNVSGRPFKDVYPLLKEKRMLSERTIRRLDPYIEINTQSEKTGAGILGAFNTPLAIFDSEIVAENTSRSDFRLDDVRKKKMTVYIGLSPADLITGRGLINLFFSQLINTNIKVLPEQDSALKYRCLLLMDEFASLGQMEIVKRGAAFIAGYNLRLLTVFQAISQLQEPAPAGYGKEGARSLITNHACQIVFAPKEEEDAKEYSERLGYYDLNVQSKNRNTQGLNASGSVSDSVQKRALMLPQEIKEMPFDEELIFIEANKPMKIEKAFYYNDDYFLDKLKAISPSLRAVKHPTQKEFNAIFASGEMIARGFESVLALQATVKEFGGN